jgi:hypothetical protein
MKNKVEIFKVEYVINGRDENWVACIAGFNSEDVVDYLIEFCRPAGVRVDSMTTLSRLDGITNKVRELVAQPILGKLVNEPAGPEKEDDSKPQKRAIIPKS